MQKYGLPNHLHRFWRLQWHDSGTTTIVCLTTICVIHHRHRSIGRSHCNRRSFSASTYAEGQDNHFVRLSDWSLNKSHEPSPPDHHFQILTRLSAANLGPLEIPPRFPAAHVVTLNVCGQLKLDYYRYTGRIPVGPLCYDARGLIAAGPVRLGVIPLWDNK